MQQGKSWIALARGRFENFLAGTAPSDPLYVSNQGMKHKLRMAGLIAAPLVLLGGLALAIALRPAKEDLYEHPLHETAQPVAAVKPVPDPKFQVKDFDVTDLHIVRESKPPMVTGVVRNNTNAAVESLEVSYYVADAQGSLMGSESTELENVKPHASIMFRVPLKNDQADSVIVRDVRPN